MTTRKDRERELFLEVISKLDKKESEKIYIHDVFTIGGTWFWRNNIKPLLTPILHDLVRDLKDLRGQVQRQVRRERHAHRRAHNH